MSNNTLVPGLSIVMRARIDEVRTNSVVVIAGGKRIKLPIRAVDIDTSDPITAHWFGALELQPDGGEELEEGGQEGQEGQPPAEGGQEGQPPAEGGQEGKGEITTHGDWTS